MTSRTEPEDGGWLSTLRRGLAAAIRTGWLIFAVLMVLVMLEYAAFLILDSNLHIMIAMNVIDAGLIMFYFMHVSRLWRREGGH